MELVLNAKHWQIFITFLIIGSFRKFVFYSDELLGIIAYIFSNVILICWYALVGIQLKKKIKSKLPFLFALFLCSVTIVIGIIVSAVLFGRAELTLMLKDKLVFFSFLILSFLLVLNLAIFPAKALRILEIGDDIDINDYFGDIFRLLFLPIGIWNIQPRLNKIAARLPGS